MASSEYKHRTTWVARVADPKRQMFLPTAPPQMPRKAKAKAPPPKKEESGWTLHNSASPLSNSRTLELCVCVCVCVCVSPSFLFTDGQVFWS
jgi:hypothetical protein